MAASPPPVPAIWRSMSVCWRIILSERDAASYCPQEFFPVGLAAAPATHLDRVPEDERGNDPPELVPAVVGIATLPFPAAVLRMTAERTPTLGSPSRMSAVDKRKHGHGRFGYSFSFAAISRQARRLGVIPGLACTGEGRCPRYPAIPTLRSARHDGSRAQRPGMTAYAWRVGAPFLLLSESISRPLRRT